MKKYNSYIVFLLITVIGILSTTTYSLYSKIDNINTTIQNLNIINSEKDLRQINNLIFESHFKDDLVLSNFNNSITIIIAFFTVLIALGAVFSFKRIDDDIEKLKTTSKTVEVTAENIKKIEFDFINNAITSITTEISLYSISIYVYLVEKDGKTIEAHSIIIPISHFIHKLDDLFRFKHNYKNNLELSQLIEKNINESVISINDTLEALLDFINTNEPTLSGEQGNHLKNGLEILHKAFEIDSTLNTLGSTGIDILIEQIIKKVEGFTNT